MTEYSLRDHGNGVAGLAEYDIVLVEHNFAVMMQFSDAMAERFYQRLFTEYPQVMPLFKSVTIEGQHKKLLASMVLLIQHLRDSEMLEDYLQGLGGRHQQYGIEASHYEMFIENWLSILAEFSDQDWSEPLQLAWRNVLEYVAELMQTPALQLAEPVTPYQINNNSAAEYALTSLAVAQTATPMVVVDLSLVIRYLNAAAESLLNEHKQRLNQMFSDISVDRLAGCSLQDFGKKMPFPIEWFSDFEQLPRSIDLHGTAIDLRLTLSVLYKNDEAEGFLLECYPLVAAVNHSLGEAEPSSIAEAMSRNTVAMIESVLHDIQLQNSHLMAMLQEIDNAVFETSLLALNCTVEAAKFGDEACQLRDFSLEIRVLNQQLSQLLQPLKAQSGQQQQQLNSSIALAQQLEEELEQNLLAQQPASNHFIERVSHQLAQQAQALTQLISVIKQKVEH